MDFRQIARVNSRTLLGRIRLGVVCRGLNWTRLFLVKKKKEKKKKPFKSRPVDQTSAPGYGRSNVTQGNSLYIGNGAKKNTPSKIIEIYKFYFSTFI